MPYKDHAQARLKRAEYYAANREKILARQKARRDAAREDRNCLAFFQNIEVAAQIVKRMEEG